MKQDLKMKENDPRKRNEKERTHEGKENQNEERNRKKKNERKIEKRKGRITKEDTGQRHDFEWCLVKWNHDLWQTVISQVTTALCAHPCVFWEMCADVEAAGQSETIIILNLCTVAYTWSQHSSMTHGHRLMSVKALKNTTFYVGLWADCLKDYYDTFKLLSPPSIYGDRSAIGHDWEGERANWALVLSLGPGNVTLCRDVLQFRLLAGLKSSLSFRLGAAQTARLCIGTKFGFRLGILNLVRISVLSAYLTVCLASVLGHIDDAMWELGNGGGCLLPVT